MSKVIFPGERLRWAREEQKLTLSQLSEIIGVSGAQISRLERGERTITSRMGISLAQALGVREEWLLEGKEPMYEEERQDVLGEQKQRPIAEQTVDNIIDSLGLTVDLEEREKMIEDYLSKLKALQKTFKAGVKVKQQEDKEEAASTRGKNVVNIGEMSGSNIQGGIKVGDTFINQRSINRVQNVPPPGSISEAQAKQIHDFIRRIGELESERLGKNAFGIVMNQFKDKFKIPSYKNLESKQFDEAVTYLQKRIKTLESSLLKIGREPISRDEYVRRIQTICKRELKWTDPFRRKEMLEYIGKASLKEFTLRELESFYNYVQGKKARKKR